jgi:hypothetical protein
LPSPSPNATVFTSFAAIDETLPLFLDRFYPRGLPGSADGTPVVASTGWLGLLNGSTTLLQELAGMHTDARFITSPADSTISGAGSTVTRLPVSILCGCRCSKETAWAFGYNDQGLAAQVSDASVQLTYALRYFKHELCRPILIRCIPIVLHTP